jgi:hypothetical protein
MSDIIKCVPFYTSRYNTQNTPTMDLVTNMDLQQIKGLASHEGAAHIVASNEKHILATVLKDPEWLSVQPLMYQAYCIVRYVALLQDSSTVTRDVSGKCHRYPQT